MKICELHIEGFRSLKDVTWKPGDLNVLIGPNGSGKSNLLRMLEMISISAEGGLSKHVQACGGMNPILWDGQAENVIWRLEALLRNSTKRRLTYETCMAHLGTSSGYSIQQETLSDRPLVDRHMTTRGDDENLLDRGVSHAKVLGKSGQVLDVYDESIPEEETLLQFVTGPSPLNRHIHSFREQLTKWCVYHDLHVHREAPIRQAAISRVEDRVDPDGQNLVNVLHTLYTGDRGFKEDINLAMRAAFGSDFEELEFPPAADQRIQLRVRWANLKRAQSMADLSDGTVRFLLLLTILASPTSPPVIAIDEPETGLHPSMLAILAEYAVDASRRSQIIFTTHSPQFLDAFKDTLPTTTVATWKEGETVLNTLDGDELREWLKGFSLGSLFESGELEGMA